MSYIRENEVCADVILFEGEEYPAWWMVFGGISYCFSTIELEEKLITEEGIYTSPAAQALDETIVYFLSEDEKQDTSYKALVRYAELEL